MRIIVLTSSTYGTASRVLPALRKNTEIDIAKVILVEGRSPDRKKTLKRKVKKLFRIGLLGAINCIRMREWYSDKDAEDLELLCNTLGLKLERTPFINCETTRQLFRDADADLGLSLGNGYIPESIFAIPKHGMLNLHSEILPQFRGAQSVIWPIYEGVEHTGFTIHQIDNGIDTGVILYQKRYPIDFHATIRGTIVNSVCKVRELIPDAFSYVCTNYEALRTKATPQEGGQSYTTPSIWQFIRMARSNSRIYRMHASRGH